jgi:hypothetical protein
MARAALAVATGLLLGWLAGTPALAEIRFILAEGGTVRGEIVLVTRNSITVRRTIGGVRQIGRNQLERVELTTADGTEVRGRLAEWRDGRIAVATGERLLWIEQGRIVARNVPGTIPASQSRPAEQPADPGAFGKVDASPDSLAPGGLEGSEAPPELPILTVGASAEVFEDAGEVVFTLELSKAVDAPMTVIYSTLDGDALGGSDYLATKGTLSLSPGTIASELRMTLLDDGEREGNESFYFLVTTIPQNVSVAEKWTSVTIRDDERLATPAGSPR